MFPCKQFWQSGCPRCHSLSPPWSIGDAHKHSRLHFSPVCSRLFFTKIPWLSLAVWKVSLIIIILLTKWLTSTLQQNRCFCAEGERIRVIKCIHGMCNEVTECREEVLLVRRCNGSSRSWAKYANNHWPNWYLESSSETPNGWTSYFTGEKTWSAAVTKSKRRCCSQLSLTWSISISRWTDPTSSIGSIQVEPQKI